MTISLWITGLIFLGSILGGGLVRILHPIIKEKYFYLNIFCGGLLAGLLSFDLIPETMNQYQSIGLIAGASAGILLMFATDHFLHGFKHSAIKRPEVFIMLFIALLIHSIPAGMALGLNFDETKDSLLRAVLVHHIPEGIVLMASVLYLKVKISFFWLVCVLISLTVGINVYLGLTLNVQSFKVSTMFMGAAIGTLSYVTFYEILWKGYKRHPSWQMLGTLLLGTLVIKLFFFIAM